MLSVQETMLAVARQNQERDEQHTKAAEERQAVLNSDNVVAQALAAAPQIVQKGKELAANARAKGRQKSKQDPAPTNHIAKGVLIRETSTTEDDEVE